MIGSAPDVTSSYLSPYLKQLEKLYLIERRLRATISPELRRTRRISRYHLEDTYLPFYFRFIAPNLSLVKQELADLLWDRISEQFRAFVGGTAFQELCHAWVLAQARAGALPEAGAGWTAHHALFERAGFTEAAQEDAQARQVLLADLARLDEDLQGTGQPRARSEDLLCSRTELPCGCLCRIPGG